MYQPQHEPKQFLERMDAKITWDGPAGLLEGLSTQPKTDVAQQKTVIICHPHPLHGGTMNNKVVHTLSRAFHNSGFYTLRFNYRGVGESEGEFGNYTGEIEDLKTILAWAQQVQPEHDFYLAGFSFGSYVAATTAQQHPEIKELFSIAPAVNNKDYHELANFNRPWLIVQGDADEIVPAQQVKDFVSNSNNQNIQLICMPSAGHFFHGQLIELRTLLENKIQSMP